MALPTIKYPTFPLTIPSTKELVKFRPYTVSEEKILLMAVESQNVSDISSAITDILSACFFQNVDVSALPNFDIEYMFLNVRAKSVSETIEVAHQLNTCLGDTQTCKQVSRIKIRIEDIKVKQYDKEGSLQVYDPKNASKSGTKLMLSDDIGVMISYPNVDKIDAANKKESVMEQMEEIVCLCINSVFDNENVYTDFTKTEMKDWYNNLLTSQKDNLIDFIKNMPMLRYSAEFKCQSCGATEIVELEGLQSFL